MKAYKNGPYCPPPSNFNPANPAEIAEARLALGEPPFIKKFKKVTGRRADGVRYERKAQAYLEAHSANYISSTWFRYFSSASSTWFWCQPDGLIFDFRRGLITIVEIKLKHTSYAWWQIRHLYQPVLQAVFGTHYWDFSALEVVKWYDPDTNFPEKFSFIDDPIKCESGSFHLHIYKGRR